MKAALACDGKVLIVGDGDFSFTVALLKLSVLRPDQVYTSNLETETSIQHHLQAAENMSSLKESGVMVFLETDARDLHNHPTINKEKYDRILFNFPLADRHNIKKNRALLADFFSSSKSLLTDQGQVLVTLCKGQGGTPADRPIRSWHDSWQVAAMATNAGLLLKEVMPFDPTEFPEYHSVGFRFQDKSFNVTGALTHVFEEGEMVQDDDRGTRGVVNRDGQSFSCSSYVASRLKRDLLTEPRNPLCILKKKIEESLSNLESGIAVINPSSPVLPSHRSSAWLELKEDLSDAEETGPARCDKDWKDSQNAMIMHKSQLAHGVSEDSKELNGRMLAEDNHLDSDLTTFLPKDNESVYILVRAKNVTHQNLEVAEAEDGDTVMMADGDVSSYGSSTQNGDTVEGMDNDQDQIVSVVCGQSLSDTSNESTVYHCRTSLFENLPHLCQMLKIPQDSSNGSSHCSTASGVESMDSGSVPSSSQSDCPSCLMTCGQCMIPCPISPSFVPTKHEMLILHQVGQKANVSQETTTRCDQSSFDGCSSRILSIIQSLVLQNADPRLSLVSRKLSRKIAVNTMEESQVVEQLMIGVENGAVSSELQRCFGCIVCTRLGDSYYHATVINLEYLLCGLCSVDDPRLIWSLNEKFLNQFQADISRCHFNPFSLYPMKFVHDLSFWEKESDSDQFDVEVLYEAVRSVVGDVVVSVCLVDVYKEPGTERRSRCYRLHFVSRDKCLPYVMSWKLQSRVRIEVAKRLGVTLR